MSNGEWHGWPAVGLSSDICQVWSESVKAWPQGTNGKLALAEEFSAKGTVLPLIMDDVLVNFDPERAEQVAGVMAEVSEQHQVLLFTCHPETRDLAKKADPDARVIELERFAG